MKKLISAIISASMIVAASAQIFTPISVQAASARYMENLDRGLVAMKTADGVYLSWRLSGTENYNSSFTVYRDGKQIATVSDSTNYLDTSGTMNSQYSVFSSSSSIKCDVVKPFASGSNFLDIPLAPIDNYIAPDGTSYPYEIRDGSVGDLDGDGQYEIVVKREANRQHAGAAGFNHMFLEAYELDGTVLWRIDMGQNMRAMTEFAFLVYDFNNDGIAEIACKTAPGTKDGTGRYVTEVSRYSWIKNANNQADYHDANGFVLTGPEYFSWFDGRNGAVIDTIDYPIFRGTDSNNSLHKIWGDNYGHRAEKCMATVAYLDGVNPSIVVWRGIYNGQPSVGDGRTALAAINISGSRLVVGNRFDTWSGGKGGYTSGNEKYIGNGNHSIAAGDIDGDGYDEVMSGGLCIDHDMKAKWCTYRQHGDAHHLADYDPLNNSLEYFNVHEDAGTARNGQTLNYGMTVIDASNGNQLFHVGADGDTGRGMMANVGAGGYYQFWGAGVYKGTGNNKFAKSSFNATSYNFRIFWDGDMYDELLDAESSGRRYNPTVFKYNSKTMGLDILYTDYNTSTINGTKATPILQADIFGDWREEFIVPTNDGLAMRIHTTNIPTTNKLYTLMHDPIYRMGVALQNQYYNQPPHIGYYVSNSRDQYDKRAVKPSIVTPVYNGKAPSLKAIPVTSGVKTRNSNYIIDEDGDYYPTHSTIASNGQTNGVWSVNGYTYAFMSAASSSVNNLWLTKGGMSNLDGRFLLFAANGKSSNFVASNPSKAITEDGTVTFDFSVPTTYSTDGYKLRGNATSNIYIGDGSAKAITFTVTPTVTDSYVTSATLAVNGEQICTYSSGAEAQSWTHVDCSIDKIRNSAVVTVTKPNGQKFTKTVSFNCGNINTFTVNPGTTWGAILLDRIKMSTGDLDLAANAKYKFDFGDGAVQSGYEAVTSSTGYSSANGYGFVGSQSGMTRAPGNIPSGMENLYNDQIMGETTFKSRIPNGTYCVTVYYGSWNTGFGTRFNIEGVDSGALASTEPSEYSAIVTVTDKMLDIGISKGSKTYGGYISGLEITEAPAPKYKFDFGDGNVQDGYEAVTSSTAYSVKTGYGFIGDIPAGMTRGPGNVPSGMDNLYGDQLNGTGTFAANIPNGTYDVTVHYGSWNTGFGTRYIIEGTDSGALSATDAATYVARVAVTDGVLNVEIQTGNKTYGGYINGLEIAKASSVPLPTATPAPTAAPTATPTPAPTATPTPTPVAYADIAEGVYYLKSANSDMYLDVANGSSSNGANVQQNTYSGSTAQQFKIVSAGNGYYKILTACSDYAQAVDVAENSAENGANILTWASGSSTNQQYKFKDAGNGKYAILTRASSLASALDVSNISTAAGANIQQYSYWGGAGQQWYLEPVADDGYAKIAEGVYRMKNVNSGKYLDVMYGVSKNGANIQQYEGNGATAQQFKIVSTGDGYYKILTRCSNYAQAIDVDGGSSADGANIQTWGDGSQTNQQFKFVEESDGSYGILTRASDLKAALDVYNVSKDNGANVCQWSYWQGAGQRWILEKVE